eukprot:TRINITY_DN40436_c0_g1_i1.p1 TRINITY_DN40436_c0_g1~~TRINITY_DN40436_c0_g1_i1.p1  ORF type:complete len:556 (-),score=86.25 TRINITY_DN40436_c0_g1_i1:56-1642(-)
MDGSEIKEVPTSLSDTQENKTSDAISETMSRLVLQHTHQFGIVDNELLLAERVAQVLDRLPAESSVHLFAGSREHLLQDPLVMKAIDGCKIVGINVTENGDSVAAEFVLYFDVPTSSSEFYDRLRLCSSPVFTYTLLVNSEDSMHQARDVIGRTFDSAQEHANDDKRVELKCAVGQVTVQVDDEEQKENEQRSNGGVEADDEHAQAVVDEDHDSQHGHAKVDVPTWPPYQVPDELEIALSDFAAEDAESEHCPKVMKWQFGRQLEVVAVSLATVREGFDDDFKQLNDAMKPEEDPSYTVLAFHHYGSHDLRREHIRQYLPANKSDRARVVFINADEDMDGALSWHDYLDKAMMDENLGDDAGCSWIDIIDAETTREGGRGMDETNRLLAQVVGFEVTWLHGQSKRLVLSGSSQGGGMAFYHFLTSSTVLGGFVGCVCHVPTAPHLPRTQDPLLRAPVNRSRPVRILSGGNDTCFAQSLVQRDLLRLQRIGGFTDVEQRIQSDADHYMGEYPDLDLKYLQEVLRTILDA